MAEEYEELTPDVTATAVELSSQKPLMLAEFAEGYSVRGIIDYLKLTNVSGTFIFSKDSITYSQSDAKNSILNNLEIRGFDLTPYTFSHDGPIAYGVNMNNLKQTMAVIGKKDSVRLISFANQPFIFIQHLGQGGNESSKRNVSMIRVQTAETVQMTVEGYRRPESDPNCTVRVQDFCKTCANIVRVKCDFVTIKGSTHGIRFQAMLDGNIAGSYYEFGSYNRAPFEEDTTNIQLKRLTEYLASLSVETAAAAAPTGGDTPIRLVIKEADDTTSHKIRSSHIKALSKLANSFKEGTVKLYMEPNLPLKLVFNNTYCRLTVFLQEERK